MAQTKEGGKKYKETMIKKHGSEEAWKSWLKSVSAKGGKNSTFRSFRDKEGLAKKAGIIGGKVSGLKRKNANTKK